MNDLHVPLHPSLRHEPLATEIAVVTPDPEVLLVHRSMLIHFTLFCHCLQIVMPIGFIYVG